MSMQHWTWARRTGAAALSLGLAAGSLTVEATSSAVATPIPHARVIADAKGAADEASAAAIAAKFGHGVAVDSLTTATTQVTALPDGTLRLVADSVPVRTKINGAWKALNLDLVRSDGYLAPAVAAQHVTFSAGGSGPLVRVQGGDGTWVSEDSPFGALPEPSVKGPTAIYPNVLPGVDMQVTATPTGVSEVLVVKTAAAATNPKLAQVRFGIHGSSLSADASGRAHAGAKGAKGVTAGIPTWWDSSQGSTAQGPGGTLMPRPVGQSVTSSSITLAAGAAAATDGVQYPVFIDPDWSSGDVHAWFIDAGFPNQAYLDSNPYSTVEKSGWIPASATGSGGVAHTARAFWNFNTSALVGKQVSAAHFNAVLNGMFNCGIMRQSNLWSTSGAPIGGTWNSTGSVYSQIIGSATPSACGAAVGFNALIAAQHAAAGTTSTTVAIRANSESDQYNWSKWNQGATLTVTYNSIPNAPTGLGFTNPSRACSTDSTAPTYIDGTQDISLQATSTDPDAGNLDTTFHVYGVTSPTYSWSAATGSEAQGATAPVVIPANTLDTGEYRWNATSNDTHVDSPVSATCYFFIELTPPALPTITEAGNTHQVGKPMTVTLDSAVADSVQLYAIWWVDGSNEVATAPPVTDPITVGGSMPACNTGASGVRYVCPTSGTAATVTVAPIDVRSTLWVASYDHTGRISVGQNGSPSTWLHVTSTSDTTGVSFAQGHFWDTADYDPAKTIVHDQSTSTATTGTTAPQSLVGAQLASGTFDDEPVTVLQLSQTSSTPSVALGHTPAPPLDPSGSYSVSFWLDPVAGTSGHVLSQTAKFSDAPGGPAWGTLFDFSYASGDVQFCAMRTYTAGACTDPYSVASGQWTLVTGVWDAVNQQARVLTGSSAVPRGAAFNASASTVVTPGPAAFGLATTDSAGSYAGSTSSIAGRLYRPAIFPGVISASQLTLMSAGFGPNAELLAPPPADPVIAAGDHHTCAVAGGQAYCWGENDKGGLGNNSTTDSAIPVAVDVSGVLAGKTVTSLAGGHLYTCAVADGQAYCWGYNIFGALGNNSGTDSNVPVAVDVSGVLAGKTVTSIAAGFVHTCAVADGRAYCWGENVYGQLGDNSTTISRAPVAVDVSGVLAGKTVTAIAAGDFYACAVADGQAYCWGDNSHGQLGNNSTTDSSVPVAVDVSGVLAGKTVTSIAAGGDHTCAVADGQAYCWGYNVFGVLGNNSTTDSSVPVAVDVSGVLAGKTVTSIAAGDDHACAVADGRAYCWGLGGYGELGNASTTSSSVPVAVDVSGALAGKTATSIDAGSVHTCGVADEQVYCWGYNALGELGDNSTTNSTTPVIVAVPGL
jgi:alpha-tubulin suppressor-like RCC1 family protein